MTNLNDQISETKMQIEDNPTYVAAREAIKQKQDELKAEMKSLGETFFKEQTAALFEEFPELKAFAWDQYTPYFNDGEACEFRVYADYMDITDLNDNVFEQINAPLNPDGTLRSYYMEKYGTLEKIVEEWNTGELDTPVWAYYAQHRACSIVTALDEDVLLALFGDHAQVVVSRDGIEVEDRSDHD